MLSFVSVKAVNIMVYLGVFKTPHFVVSYMQPTKVQCN